MSFDPVVELSSLDGANGFQLNVEGLFPDSFVSVSSAGDVNGDGFEDVIVGAPDNYICGCGYQRGASYVVFGSDAGFPAELDVSALDGTNGFAIPGEAPSDQNGISVDSAGDVNGDGFDDLIIGAPDPYTGYGSAYVVFGHGGLFAADLDLSTLDGSTGFQLTAATDYDATGISVSSAGDVNGDGFDDVIVGAPAAYANGLYSGAAYVVFGQASGFTAEVDLGALDGADGFALYGEAVFDFGGESVSSADVNGDGFSDLIVGADGSNANGYNSGITYVVYGHAGPFNPALDLATLNGIAGFEIKGEAPLDGSGVFVSSAGDVNGDGFEDVVVADLTVGGSTYVVFGQADPDALVLLSGLDGTDGFEIIGAPADAIASLSVSSAGDVNGDGFDDVIVGAYTAQPNGLYDAGTSYVVYGGASGFPAEIDVSTLDGTNGFRIDGEAAYDHSGVSVSSAGDVNNDGFDDLVVGADGVVTGLSYGAAYVIFGVLPDTAVTRIGTIASQTLAGGDFNDTLSGMGGDDRLVGNGGNDRLDGGVGDDRMEGRAGKDTYVVDSTGDTVLEEPGGGADTVQSSITYTLGANLEKLTLTGSDVIHGAGNELDNEVTGNDAANLLYGGSGNDRLNGGADADRMTGGLGDDTYVVDNAGDLAIEHAGNGADLVKSTISFTLPDNIENLMLEGTAPIDGTGNGLANVMSGNSAANVLSGIGGNDTLVGFGGNDRLDGGIGADTMTGGLGDDTYIVDDAGDTASEASGGGVDTVLSTVTFTLAAGIENLVLNGTAAIDGAGNASANSMFGNSAANRLEGDAGNDTLTGFGGADVFVFGDGDGADTVMDFQDGSDTCDLTAVAGVDEFSDLALIDNGATVTVDYGTGSITFANIADAAAIDASDFVFV